ncbi:glycosyltransferase family 2 protein [Candidatus Babeliales bacterium]|nr:glycosyltransferase family 2 protein [Candidatus Babeliales bacterium]
MKIETSNTKSNVIDDIKLNRKMLIQLSLIIPTHNRAPSLKRVLDNIFDLTSQDYFKINFEIIVVDNNSKDATKDIVLSYGDKVKYVFEENTSFTKARHTGAHNAQGEILVYLDDDICIKSGTFEEIVRIFSQNSDCGVAGGKILAHFEQTPPDWVTKLQASFNGLSLFNLGDTEKKVHAVPAPLMAIRKIAFDAVGGFPPDTVGVETNKVHKTFKKLYIGPGDYAFCLLCRNVGYSIIYSPKIVIEHIISPFRLTKEFWLSRMIGEGHCIAVTQANMKELKIEGARAKKIKRFNRWKEIKHFFTAKLQRIKGIRDPLLVDEMWFEYYRSRRSMEYILSKNPHLASYLWQIGLEGIPDKDFETVLKKLPKAYQDLAL